MELAAWLTGLAGLITAAGGVVLAVRAARSSERKATSSEIDELSTMLATERAGRIACERDAYTLRRRLAEHGLEP